jgi:hypothetical protein
MIDEGDNSPEKTRRKVIIPIRAEEVMSDQSKSPNNQRSLAKRK